MKNRICLWLSLVLLGAIAPFSASAQIAGLPSQIDQFAIAGFPGQYFLYLAPNAIPGIAGAAAVMNSSLQGAVVAAPSVFQDNCACGNIIGYGCGLFNLAYGTRVDLRATATSPVIGSFYRCFDPLGSPQPVHRLFTGGSQLQLTCLSAGGC